VGEIPKFWIYMQIAIVIFCLAAAAIAIVRLA
jgi:hypothetical protein